MLGPSLALGSSLGYGLGDFLGGTTSRRIGTLRFIFCAQLVGVALAGGWVALASAPMPPLGAVAAAVGAGLGLTVGMAAFFQAMAVGKMSLVAPISATGVAVPIAAGILRGEHPSAVQVIGVIAAISGVVLVARPPGDRRSDRTESGLGLALLAALGTGVFLWLMAPASRHSVAWAIFICRAIPTVLLSVVFGIQRPSLRPALQPRTLSMILVQAFLGFTASTLYAFATRHGQLVVVSVLGSLYPAVTVMLAYRLLDERLTGVQKLAVLAVLGGVVLLSV